MALVDENDITLGLRGKFGKQFVFRKLGTNTVAARRGNPVDARTVAQLAHRARFSAATRYARVKMLDPEAKAEYLDIARRKQYNSAFVAAVSDYLTEIEIRTIETSGYTGMPSYPIIINVNDLAKVKKMIVTLRDANGTVLETGLATAGESSIRWTYLTKIAIPDITGVAVIVDVIDRPGNRTQKVVIL